MATGAVSSPLLSPQLPLAMPLLIFGARAVEQSLTGQPAAGPLQLLAAMFFLARKTTPAQLALITATIGIIAQWSKIHGTGVYVNWYYPFLLIGLLCSARAAFTKAPSSAAPGRDRLPE